MSSHLVQYIHECDTIPTATSTANTMGRPVDTPAIPADGMKQLWEHIEVINEFN